MFLKIRKYLPSTITAALGILVVFIIPAQIDLSRVRSGNITGVNSRVIPYVLAISVVALSILEIILTKVKKETEVENVGAPDYKAFLRVGLTVIAILLWIFLMPILGFVISMFVLMVFIMVLMGNRRWIIMISVSLLTSMTLWYVFTNFIGRSLPAGIFL